MNSNELLEFRRAQDAILTQKVFQISNIQKLAEKCADELKQIPGTSYYLKGGNAISLLKPNQPLTSDWDFQLKPSDEVYENWIDKFLCIDSKIIAILTGIGALFTENHDSIKAVFDSFTHPELTSHTAKNNKDCFLLGKVSYMNSSYSGIMCDANYKRDPTTGNGRLTIGEGDKVSITKVDMPSTAKLAPCVYANYTIPGFILYRLALRFDYTLANTNELITLKSELIDISVPRLGSAEIHMAMDGVITTFFEVGQQHKIRIPGWSYHLYENINLLQEIKLGISGSADKKSKREARAKDSFEALKKLNNSKIDLITKSEAEIRDSNFPNSKAVSFVGAYLSIFKSDKFPLKDAANILIKELTTVIGERLTTTVHGSSGTITAETLTQFDFTSLERYKVSEVKFFLSEYLNEPASAISSKFKIISPLLDLKENDKFPLPFVLVCVHDDTLIDNLKKDSFTRMNGNQPITVTYNGKRSSPSKNDVVIWRTAGAASQSGTMRLQVRYVFVKMAASALTYQYKIEDYLKYALFVSQRAVLADAYQTKIA